MNRKEFAIILKNKRNSNRQDDRQKYASKAFEYYRVTMCKRILCVNVLLVEITGANVTQIDGVEYPPTYLYSYS